ncbi:MAG: RagB/SusD family nutrient uptake outer membrane protein [Chitinophagales bacterium]|nr:RagB/SusD family nutrient uptake outer membrane protein [Chitinophagales bacterium]
MAEKPDQALIIASTLKDYDALLNNTIIVNGSGIGVVPSLGEIYGDDYYIAPHIFENDLPHTFYRDSYTWSDNTYNDPVYAPKDWSFSYRCVFYANTILEGLAKLTATQEQQQQYNQIKGSALFFRAHSFYWLAQLFSPHYDKNTANTDLGIPLKQSADITEKINRSSVQQTYEKIIADLNEALPLLVSQPTLMTQPSKLAVYGLLARIYLTMGEYDKALSNSTLYLGIKNELIDFSSLPPNSYYSMPDPKNNVEISFYSILIDEILINLYPARIDSTIYASYNNDDLRKALFFEDAASDFGIPDDYGKYFSGSYDRTNKYFAGISTNEIYLIRAECYARTGNISSALQDLNDLMRKRWKNSVPYPSITASTQAEALDKVLTERRKELLFRGLRWVDIRRFNKEGANISITRNIDGQIYTLPANSNKFTHLIPPEVIDFNPGLQQNPR